MTSPDRMQLMEERTARLANLLRDLAQAELEDRERMLVHEGWMRMHEERMQTMEAQRRESDERMLVHEERMRMHEERMQGMEAQRRESDERVRAIIATLTEMQADLARIDAGA